MTEKRFEVIKSEITGLYVPIDNNKEFVFEGVEKASTILKLTGLLNAQHKENEQLKIKNRNLIKISVMTQAGNDKLKEENKQLKSYNMELEDYLTRLEEKILGLEKALKNEEII